MVVVVLQLVELGEPGVGGLLEQRGPGERVLGRVGSGYVEEAGEQREGEPLEEQRAGHDGEGDEQQHLAVRCVLGDDERGGQGDHAAHAGPADEEGPRGRDRVGCGGTSR